MDLLKQILARLPLQRLLDLEAFLFDQSFFYIRLRVVNRLPEEYLRNLSRTNVYLSYVHICTAQGELCRESHNFLNRTMLCARAAFLRERDPYLWFQRVWTKLPDLSLEIAFASEDLEIIMSTLESSRDPYSICDLESVNWRLNSFKSRSESKSWQLDPDDKPPSRKRSDYPPIVTFYRNLITASSKVSSKHVMRIAGYLHIPMNSIDFAGNLDAIVEYAVFYIVATMKCFSDPFTNIPVLDQFLKSLPFRKPSTVAMIGGYFGFPEVVSSDDRNYASMFIQPKLLQTLPGGEFRLARGIYLTPNLVERAREMLALVEKYHPENVAYRMQMEVIVGNPIDMVQFNELPVEDRISVEFYMYLTAHPQLNMDIPTVNFPSSIKYDLINCFKIDRARRELSKSQNSLRLYACGKLLQCFDADQMKDLAGTMKDMGEF